MSRHTSSWLLVPVAINVFSSLIVFSCQDVSDWPRSKKMGLDFGGDMSVKSRVSERRLVVVGAGLVCVFLQSQYQSLHCCCSRSFLVSCFPEQKKSKNPVTVYIVGMFAENREKRREDNLSSQKSECLWADLGSAGSCPSLLCYRMKV